MMMVKVSNRMLTCLFFNRINYCQTFVRQNTYYNSATTCMYL